MIARSLVVAWMISLSAIASAQQPQAPADSVHFQTAKSAIRAGRMAVDVMELVAPRRYTELAAKFAEAAQKNPGVMLEKTRNSKPGEPLEYDPRFGLTEEEYAEMLSFGNPFRAVKKSTAVIHVEQLDDGHFRFTANGLLSDLDGVEVDFARDRLRTPFGNVEGGNEVHATPESVLGVWDGWEWEFAEEALPLNARKIQLAIGKQKKTGRFVLHYEIKKLTPVSKTDFFHILTFEPTDRQSIVDDRMPTKQQLPRDVRDVDVRKKYAAKAVTIRIPDQAREGAMNYVSQKLMSCRETEVGFYSFYGKDNYYQGEIAPINDFAAFCDKVEALEHFTIQERDDEQRKILVEVDWKQVAKAEPSFKQEAMASFGRFKLPDEDDPEYLSKLADLLGRRDPLMQQKAAKALLEYRPEELPNTETHRKIAKSFLQLASEPFPDSQSLGIRGMVHFGGKRSVKYLLKMLREAKLAVDPLVYETLAKYPREESAAAIAARLGNVFDADAPERALIKMNKLAEPAVIDALHTNDPNKALAAVQVLERIGTEACLAPLRKAQGAGDLRVEAAASRAILAVNERRKQ